MLIKIKRIRVVLGVKKRGKRVRVNWKSISNLYSKKYLNISSDKIKNLFKIAKKINNKEQQKAIK